MEPDVRDRGALLTTLTTEHFTLQGARSGTITESLGRTTIYLGSLSASLVALALVFQGSAVADFRLFALVILPAVVFLGTVTFVRVLETGIEDGMYALAINRIRHYYLELAGDDARYFVLGGNDDVQGVLANMGLAPSRLRPFYSAAGVVAVINSMVVGALAGIVFDVFVPRAVAVIVGVFVAVVALIVHFRLGQSRFLRAMENLTPQFPSDVS
jgi:hypothetical protein